MQTRFTVALTLLTSAGIPIADLYTSKHGTIWRTMQPNGDMKTIPLTSELQSLISEKLRLFEEELMRVLLSNLLGHVTPGAIDRAENVIPALSDGMRLPKTG